MELFIYFLIFILCYFISGIVHELGHVIVGLTNGWKFYILVIGPLGIKRDENDKIKLYFEKRIVLWAGVASTLPRFTNNENIKVWSKILLGGPLASIITGIFSLSLGVVFQNVIFLLIGSMSLGMGIICILPIPLKTGILYSDGARMYRIHKGGQEADEEIALFRIVENNITNNNFINLKDIESLIKSKEKGIQYYGYYCKYKYYKTQNNNEEMKLAIQKMNDLRKAVSSIIVSDCKVD